MSEPRTLLEIELEVSRLRTRLLEEQLGQAAPARGKAPAPRRPRHGRRMQPLSPERRAELNPLHVQQAQQIVAQRRP